MSILIRLDDWKRDQVVQKIEGFLLHKREEIDLIQEALREKNISHLKHLAEILQIEDQVGRRLDADLNLVKKYLCK